MRIRTDEKFSHRRRVIEDVAEMWGCNKSEALMRSARFAMMMLDEDDLRYGPGALHRALEHPDMTAELADVLSCDLAQLRYVVDADLSLNPDSGDIEK